MFWNSQHLHCLWYSIIDHCVKFQVSTVIFALVPFFTQIPSFAQILEFSASPLSLVSIDHCFKFEVSMVIFAVVPFFDHALFIRTEIQTFCYYHIFG